MLRYLIFLLILLASSKFSEANDSVLYKKRIDKINAFYGWLSKRPFENVNIHESDTTSSLWIAYDTAVNIFFNRQMLDSAYKNTGRPNDIFSPAAKFQLLKQAISTFHHLTLKQCFDNLKFKSSGEEGIVQYYLIDNKEYKLTAFYFLPGSDQLLGMPIMGMPEDEYKVFKLYFDNLKPCDKR